MTLLDTLCYIFKYQIHIKYNHIRYTNRNFCYDIHIKYYFYVEKIPMKCILCLVLFFCKVSRKILLPCLENRTKEYTIIFSYFRFHNIPVVFVISQVTPCGNYKPAFSSNEGRGGRSFEENTNNKIQHNHMKIRFVLLCFCRTAGFRTIRIRLTTNNRVLTDDFTRWARSV